MKKAVLVVSAVAGIAWLVRALTRPIGWDGFLAEPPTPRRGPVAEWWRGRY